MITRYGIYRTILNNYNNNKYCSKFRQRHVINIIEGCNYSHVNERRNKILRIRELI